MKLIRGDDDQLVCPSPGCGSDMVGADSFVEVGHLAYRDCWCGKCNTHWKHVYLLIGYEGLRWHCKMCLHHMRPEAFAGHHVCRACGDRICDDCAYETGQWCLEHENSKAREDEERATLADIFYDRSKDR